MFDPIEFWKQQQIAGDARYVETERQKILAITGGRQIVVNYRKGGRILENRRYDIETVSDKQGILAINLPLTFGGMVMEGEKKWQVVISTEMIGKRWVGFAPWEPDEVRFNRTPTAEDKFNFNTPMSIADVIELDGKVIIEVESV